MPAPAIYETTVSLTAIDPHFTRADIAVHDLDHSGASFEGRIFLNHADADENTARTSSEGYAGSFYIFGHGGCYGDEGHCDTVPRRRYDPRPGHPLTPQTKIVIATEAIKRALTLNSQELHLTIVGIITSLNEKCATEGFLSFDQVQIVTYR